MLNYNFDKICYFYIKFKIKCVQKLLASLIFMKFGIKIFHKYISNLLEIKRKKQFLTALET